MASLTVFDQSGSEVGKYEIDHAEIAPRISKQLLHDVVVMYQANLRQGSHKTKSRAEVSGTNKKMYRQKGTGKREGRWQAQWCSSGRWAYFCSPQSGLFIPYAEKGDSVSDSNGDCFQGSRRRGCGC